MVLKVLNCSELIDCLSNETTGGRYIQMSSTASYIFLTRADGVCVIIHYPAAYGPKAHGSSSASAEAAAVGLSIKPFPQSGLAGDRVPNHQ